VNRVSLAVAAFASLIAIPSMAADFGVPLYNAPLAVYTWTGCYIGGNVGAGWLRQNANEETLDPAFNAGPGSVSLRSSGTMGGAHAGCNVEGTYGLARGVVVGIEADWSGMKLQDTQTAPNTFLGGLPVGVGSIAFSEDAKWLVSIRGRAGLAMAPNLLLYTTIGVAWSHSEYSGLHTYTVCPNCSAATLNFSNFGWVAGAGIEWAVADSNWLLRIEGLYYIIDGGTTPGTLLATGTTNTTWFWNNLGITETRIGLSYKFGPSFTTMRAK
jgi:outer membrane immunogenic protein